MRHFIFLYFMLCSGFMLVAQPKLPDITPASPEASALAKYINYPVNYGTGLVNINIPLYEIKVGDLTLPISLSYHASGIKVTEECGWIGLGWTLNAEPSVSRSVKNAPDESGYLFNSRSVADYDPHCNYLKDLANGRFLADEDPDAFYYKLLDKNGGFHFQRLKMNTLDKSFEIVTNPYEPIKIFSSNMLSEFNITDEKGIDYQFSEKEYFEGSSYYPTQWKATQITSKKTGEILSFQYYPTTRTYLRALIDITTIQDNLIGHYTGIKKGCVGNPGPFLGNSINGNDSIYIVGTNGILINEDIGCPHIIKPSAGIAGYSVDKKLKKINFSNGYADFENDINNKLLKIKIFDKNDKVIRIIQLHRSLYLSGDRYKLDGIDIMDSNGLVVEKYKFDYQSGLPQKTSKDIDHWGYYNAANNHWSKSSVPLQEVSAIVHSHTFSFTIGNANREVNDTATQAGIIKSITYPTGGKTVFEYEGNKYKDPYSVNSQKILIAGGLRIANIKDYSTDGTLQLERTFKYGQNEDGMGYAKHKITLDDYMREQTMHYLAGTETIIDQGGLSIGYSGTAPYRLRTYNSNSLPDLFYSNGSPVVYNYVTEYRKGFGKTIYEYDYVPTYTLIEKDPKRPYVWDTHDSWKQGNLTKQEDYKFENNKYKLVSKKTFFYTPYKKKSTKVGKAIEIDVNNPFPYPEVEYYYYNIESGCVRVTSEAYSEFNALGEIKTEKKYYYNPDDGIKFLEPFKIETSTSKGDVITEEFKYTEYMTQAGDSETARNKLISENHLNVLLEQTRTHGVAVEKTFTEYKIENGLTLPWLIKTNTGADQAYENQIRYNKYDERGNPLSISYEAGPEIIFLWGYNYQYPIAKIENSSYIEVESALRELGTSPIDLANTTNTNINIIDELRLKLPNSHIFTYEHNSLVGVKSVKDPNGQATFYNYDDFGRLIRVLDNNAKVLKQFEYNYKNQ